MWIVSNVYVYFIFVSNFNDEKGFKGFSEVCSYFPGIITDNTIGVLYYGTGI